jgi:hypothetical protein
VLWILIALCAAISASTPAIPANLEMPAVPNYRDQFQLLTPPTITQPLYGQEYSRQGAPSNNRNHTQDENETIGQWFVATYYHTIRDPVALFTFVLSVSTIGLWIVTWRSGVRQSRETRAATKAAEDAVEASLAALAHSRETAERDFRPRLTLNASLISPVDIDLIRDDYDDDEEGVAFFIELKCRNVGKVAAGNVIYSVSGIDIAHNEDSGWLQELIDASVHACKFAGPHSWMADHSLEWSYDSLAPSEEYKAKRWCQIAPLKPDSVWRSVPKERRIYRFCVGIVAAYSSVGTSGQIFYTAKMFPVGKVNLPEFLGLIRHTEIPIGIDEVGLGPTYKAITT